ncbi:MAG: toll/interleukin-1 receptor domain-containing protein [Nitrospira sp.]|nr:toll/interleukin-1 receptor domain-containing protein [Nitrospira sp.]
MAGIFISYRQADAKAWAIRLGEELENAFGNKKVFLDKNVLTAGPFLKQIHCALDRCNVVLVVIGPRWLTIADEQNRPRLTLPDDVHRQEIALALRHPDVTVIPVLVDEAEMPRAEQLPDDVDGLAGQQAYKIGDTKARWKADLDVLIKAIEAVSGLVARKPAGQFFWLKFHAIAVLSSVGFTAILATYYNHSPYPPLRWQEMIASFVFIYAMTSLGKLFWRYLRGQRRVA